MDRPVLYPISFAFRLTLADAERLRIVADARGVKPAEMAREIVSRDIGLAFERRGTRRYVRHGAQLQALLTELWRQGNNLNQAAKRMHIAGITGAADPALAALAEIAAALTRIERAILDAIGTDDGARL